MAATDARELLRDELHYILASKFVFQMEEIIIVSYNIRLMRVANIKKSFCSIDGIVVM